jgi:hypothetical protein
MQKPSKGKPQMLPLQNITLRTVTVRQTEVNNAKSYQNNEEMRGPATNQNVRFIQKHHL